MDARCVHAGVHVRHNRENREPEKLKLAFCTVAVPVILESSSAVSTWLGSEGDPDVAVRNDTFVLAVRVDTLPNVLRDQVGLQTVTAM